MGVCGLSSSGGSYSVLLLAFQPHTASAGSTCLCIISCQSFFTPGWAGRLHMYMYSNSDCSHSNCTTSTYQMLKIRVLISPHFANSPFYFLLCHLLDLHLPYSNLFLFPHIVLPEFVPPAICPTFHCLLPQLPTTSVLGVLFSSSCRSWTTILW